MRQSDLPESAVQVPAVSTVCSPVHLELVQVEVVVAQSASNTENWCNVRGLLVN